MWFAVVALGFGLAVGWLFPVSIPIFYGRYLSIAVLAALDSALGGGRANLEGKFSATIFVSGFFSNAIIAAFLTYLGDKLGVELYYAALFAFGIRIFQNLGIIRRYLFKINDLSEKLKFLPKNEGK